MATFHRERLIWHVSSAIARGNQKKGNWLGDTPSLPRGNAVLSTKVLAVEFLHLEITQPRYADQPMQEALRWQ